jgi:hypothetical protein
VLALLALIVGAILTDGRVALAKGVADKLMIRGPGLASELEVTDPVVLEALGWGAPADFGDRQTLVAPTFGASYEIVRFLKEQDGVLRPWDRLHYYPQPAGSRGLIFYDGQLGPDSTEFDGHWFSAEPAAEAVLRCFLQQHGVVLADPHVRAVAEDVREPRLTISGPGLPGEVAIADRTILAALDVAQLEDYASSLRGSLPPAAGAGYAITRYARERDGVYRPWDRLHYYPRRAPYGARSSMMASSTRRCRACMLASGSRHGPRPSWSCDVSWTGLAPRSTGRGRCRPPARAPNQASG